MDARFQHLSRLQHRWALSPGRGPYAASVPTASRLDTRATGNACSHLAARASRCGGRGLRGSSSAE